MATVPRCHLSRHLLANQPVELCSGIDSLCISAQGAAPLSLLDTLEAARLQAEADALPVPFDLGGYPVKVWPRSFGKYRYSLTHELAQVGITPSDKLPVVRVQPTALAIHSLGPELTVLWVQNVLDAAGIVASLHVSRLDLHSGWQGLDRSDQQLGQTRQAHRVRVLTLRALPHPRTALRRQVQLVTPRPTHPTLKSDEPNYRYQIDIVKCLKDLGYDMGALTSLEAFVAAGGAIDPRAKFARFGITGKQKAAD
jgi:hypothetical protein